MTDQSHKDSNKAENVRVRDSAFKKRGRRLDSYDEKILKKLAIDGRISWRQLAEHIHLSQTPTLRRVHFLEENGYIAGYTAVLNEEKVLGSMLLVLIVSIEPQSYLVFEANIVNVSQIIFCSMMSPNIEYQMCICAESMMQAYTIIELISSFEGVKEMTSHPLVKVMARPSQIPQWRLAQR